MAEAQDFKKIHSKGYKVWRILQAPGVWAQVYRNRETLLKNYKSAIIFPEQLLGLNQNEIYCVDLVTKSGERAVSVKSVTQFSVSLGNDVATSFDDIVEWESENHTSNAMKNMTLSGMPISYQSSRLQFSPANLFSSKKDAVKMATRFLETF